MKKDGLNNELVIMENIEIKIDNIKVCGVITFRSNHDLRVEITEPFSKLESSCHMANFADSLISYKEDFGIERAKSLLEELYCFCIEVSNKKEEIKNVLPLYEKENRCLTDLIQEQKNLVISLNKQFKKDERNALEYQERIVTIRRKITLLESDRDMLRDSCFKNVFDNKSLLEEQHIEYFRRL